MTNEQSIRHLEDLQRLYLGNEKFTADIEAIGIAIEALKKQPCEDCISRKAVKEQMIKYGFKAPDMTVTEFVEDCLPSVTPERPTGKWFIDERPESNREVVCSNCDQPIFKYHKLDFDYRPKYCPNCGARMTESEDKE